MSIKYYTEEEFDALDRVTSVIDNGYSMITKAFENKYRGKRVGKGYNYIPMETRFLVEQFLKAQKVLNRKGYKLPTLLDVGCGPGLTLILASAAGFKPSGIEIVPELFKEAEVLLKHVTRGQWGTVHNKDALKYKDYDKFDVIYYYCPIEDFEIQSKLEKKIENQMKVGAILIACLKQNRDIQKDKRFKRIKGNEYSSDNMWRKVKK